MLRRLLIVATGTITNVGLLALFGANLDAVVGALEETDFVELGSETMVAHRRRGEPTN